MFPDLSYVGNFIFKLEPDGWISVIKTYGLFLFLGIYLGGKLLEYLVKREMLINPILNERLLNIPNFFNQIVLISAIGGIVGAKGLALLEYDSSIFSHGVIDAVLYKSGISFLGGFLLVSSVILIYFKFHKLPALPLLDSFAPSVLLGYAFGRAGCHLSGDGDWGIKAGSPPEWWSFPDWLYGYDFPNNVLQRGKQIEACTYKYSKVLPYNVYPTSLYESIGAFCCCLLLIAINKKSSGYGEVFSGFLIYLGLSRFLIEFIRVNPKYMISSILLSQSQIISFLIVLFGVAFYFFCRKNRNLH